MTHFLRAVFFSVGRALRETGQALDRVGLRVLEKPVFMEPCARGTRARRSHVHARITYLAHAVQSAGIARS